MRKRSEQIILSVLICAFGSRTPAYAIAEKDGWPHIQKLIAVFSKWKTDEPDASINRLAANYIDYEAMAQRSLSAAQWSKLTPDQKKRYVGTLQTLMEQRYYPRWHRIFSKAKVSYVSESDSAGDALIQTNMVVGKKTDALVWRLNEKNEKVISLAIGNKDLLNKLKGRLQSKLEKTDFNGLLSWMQAHAKERSQADQTASTEALAGESK